jgi:hypothetical protein
MENCANLMAVFASVGMLSVFDKIYVFGASIRFSKPAYYSQIIKWADARFSQVEQSDRFDKMIWLTDSELPNEIRSSFGGGRLYCVIYSREPGRAEYLRLFKDIGFGRVGFAVFPEIENEMLDKSGVDFQGALSRPSRVSVGMFR